jgi:hypothetical protein
MRGRDGVVLASDRRELLSAGPGDCGFGPATNFINKIRFDNVSLVAWAFAGGEISPIAAGYLEQELQGVTPTLAELKAMMTRCGDAAWQAAARGPNSNSTLLLVHGPAKKFIRAKLSPRTIVEELEDGMCQCGQTYNVASFFPQHFYSPDMTVQELLRLAAYAVKTAGTIDPLCVAGVDVLVYGDADRSFRFVDQIFIEEESQRIDRAILASFLNTPARPLSDDR